MDEEPAEVLHSVAILSARSRGCMAIGLRRNMTGRAVSKMSLSNENRLHLRQLTPRYDPAHHGMYAHALYNACNPTGCPQPKNVSLMGSYGTGKSSIIQGFEHEVRRSYIESRMVRFDRSLNRLVEHTSHGFREWLELTLRARWQRHVESQIAQYSAPGCIKVTSLLLCPEDERKSTDRYEDGDIHDIEETTTIDGKVTGIVSRTEKLHKLREDYQTEQIQKEIIKQLIYGVKPYDVEKSHFRRLRSRHVLREYVRPCVMVALTALVLVVIGDLLGNGFAVDRIGHHIDAWAVLWLLLTVIGCTVVAMFLDRLQTFSIQTTLSDSVSLSVDERHTIDIFDKYVDEIVFLLEKERTRYVIFEDLDRAADWNIYYELRELNTLINASTQAHGQTVTFIYVMGDAAMDINRYDVDSGKWQDDGDMLSSFEVAERKAKFFDVNVYVRPFVTVGNAGAIFSDMLTADTCDDTSCYRVDDFRDGSVRSDRDGDGDA
ncbi:DNA-binding protein [Bifidobacterium hapali]|uniref:DNA-binding protein n=2 Tax=Bifidobacterium hapali TaxID=1630172 RepID=A0A261G054_9BIFI|nr:DNA-binding protein [Bifidobacterium hapali]